MAEIGHMTDADGDELVFAVYGDKVCIESDGACLITIGPEQGEEFMSLYSRACKATKATQ